MAEPVGDLVVDLSLDAARFDEQMARVRRHFSGTESDAKKTAAVVEQSLSRQALAAQKAGISVGQYKAAMRIREAEETKNNLMQVASEHIAPLQDAADLEIATEEEISLLEAWKKYRVLLNRVNTTTAPDIEWPTVPIIE